MVLCVPVYGLFYAVVKRGLRFPASFLEGIGAIKGSVQNANRLIYQMFDPSFRAPADGFEYLFGAAIQTLHIHRCLR